MQNNQLMQEKMQKQMENKTIQLKSNYNAYDNKKKDVTNS